MGGSSNFLGDNALGSAFVNLKVQCKSRVLLFVNHCSSVYPNFGKTIKCNDDQKRSMKTEAMACRI